MRYLYVLLLFFLSNGIAKDNANLLNELISDANLYKENAQEKQKQRFRNTVKYICGNEMECLKNNNSQQLTENTVDENKRENSNRNTENSSSSNKGVKRVYFGGYKTSQGYKIQIIQCRQGNSYTAFKKNNFWYDGTGFNYGEKFKGLSLSDFAVKKCE